MTSQMREPISETATHVAQQAGEKMDQAVDLAKQQTTSRLEDERERVADGLYNTAHALRQVSQQLREQEQEKIASVADRAAKQAERASGYLRSRNLPGILDETEQVGRAHPMLFMGGALGLGLLSVRFLKSSRRQQQAAVPASSPASLAPSTYSPPAVSQKDEQFADRAVPVSPRRTENTMPTPLDDEFSKGEAVDEELHTLSTPAAHSGREQR